MMPSPRAARAAELVAHGCIRPDRACEHKQAYPTRNDAKHAAKAVAREHGRRVDTYKCPFCRGYHLTKRPHGDDSDD